jgi:hypothetical protein
MPKERPTPPALPAPDPLRRTLLRAALGGGAGLGLGLVTGCTFGAEPSSTAAPAVCTPGASGASGAPSEPTAPLHDPLAAGMPFRQDDPVWGKDLMWDRDLVIRADHELNGATLTQARSLMRAFPDGNTIANEGCLLTAMAMTLQLLAPRSPAWTPRELNTVAHEGYFYTPCGLSMTTLNADFLSELSEGAVQLALKEEYLPGVRGWPKVFPHTSALVRAYRSLAPAQRTAFVVLLKTGTYDDTVASHYLLLHPNDDSGADDPNPRVLDPAQPFGTPEAWRLTDSARAITQDPDIAAGWRDAGIEPTQIGGAWVYVRGAAQRDGSAIAPLVRAWARELSRG